MLNSLVDYYYIAESQRAVDILLKVQEPHDKVSVLNNNKIVKEKYHLIPTSTEIRTEAIVI